MLIKSNLPPLPDWKMFPPFEGFKKIRIHIESFEVESSEMPIFCICKHFCVKF